MSRWPGAEVGRSFTLKRRWDTELLLPHVLKPITTQRVVVMVSTQERDEPLDLPPLFSCTVGAAVNR